MSRGPISGGPDLAGFLAYIRFLHYDIPEAETPEIDGTFGSSNQQHRRPR